MTKKQIRRLRDIDRSINDARFMVGKRVKQLEEAQATVDRYIKYGAMLMAKYTAKES